MTVGVEIIGSMSKNRHSILIVEDHEDTARAISKLLLREGHEVHVEQTIGGAVSFCQQPNHRIDLLIADITLPDGDGWDLMRRLMKICHPLKGIAFSGHGMPNDLEKSRLAGFTEHLTKPVLFEDLLASISRVMNRHSRGTGWSRWGIRKSTAGQHC